MRKKKQQLMTNGLSLLPFIEEFHSKNGTTDLYTMVDHAVMALEQGGYIKHPQRAIYYGRFLTKDIEPTGKTPVIERDFEALAQKLIDLFPKGNQPGTGYPWRYSLGGTIQRLEMLMNCKVLRASFTDEEALRAARSYTAAITQEKGRRILKYFIIKKTDEGYESDLLTWIEKTKDLTEEELEQQSPAPLEEADLL